jgi:hypothetical protein
MRDRIRSLAYLLLLLWYVSQIQNDGNFYHRWSFDRNRNRSLVRPIAHIHLDSNSSLKTVYISIHGSLGELLLSYCTAGLVRADKVYRIGTDDVAGCSDLYCSTFAQNLRSRRHAGPVLDLANL